MSLTAIPLFWLVATLLVFEGVDTLSRASGRHPLCHPVLWSTPLLVAMLKLTATPYDAYLAQTGLLGFLLGPAVVAMAVPIWRERHVIRRLFAPIALALAAGSITAIVSTVGILAALGAPRELLASAAPRATTTPVAMALASQLGGVPSLAAVLVLIAGIIGAMTGAPLFNALRITDRRARGFGIGVSSHGIGAARAFQASELAGSFASLAMALNAVLTAVLCSALPLVI